MQEAMDRLEQVAIRSAEPSESAERTAGDRTSPAVRRWLPFGA